MGTDSFIASIDESLSSEGCWEEVPERKMLQERPTMEAVLKLVAEAYKLSPTALFVDGRKGHAEARMVAMALSRYEAGCSLTEIAKKFGVKYVTISSAIIRYKRKCQDDERVLQKVKKVRDQLYKT